MQTNSPENQKSGNFYITDKGLYSFGMATKFPVIGITVYAGEEQPSDEHQLGFLRDVSQMEFI
jgi:hypothetical protein